MLKKNKNIFSSKQIKAFSLIEIIISLAIFSFLISSVTVISIQMVSTQKRIQSKLFLTQTAQTTIEGMTRRLRFGYAYSGTTLSDYNLNQQNIIINSSDVSGVAGSSASSTQILSNAENSPFILFEAQNGNPGTFVDQIAFCVENNKLYRVSVFTQDTSNANFYRAKCSSGSSLLPDNIFVKNISFDIVAGISESPKNPMVRIKIQLNDTEGETIDMQTTVTQRLVTYF